MKLIYHPTSMVAIHQCRMGSIGVSVLSCKFGGEREGVMLVIGGGLGIYFSLRTCGEVGGLLG